MKEIYGNVLLYGGLALIGLVVVVAGLLTLFNLPPIYLAVYFAVATPSGLIMTYVGLNIIFPSIR